LRRADVVFRTHRVIASETQPRAAVSHLASETPRSILDILWFLAVFQSIIPDFYEKTLFYRIFSLTFFSQSDILCLEEGW